MSESVGNDLPVQPRPSDADQIEEEIRNGIGPELMGYIESVSYDTKTVQDGFSSAGAYTIQVYGIVLADTELRSRFESKVNELRSLITPNIGLLLSRKTSAEDALCHPCTN